MINEALKTALGQVKKYYPHLKSLCDKADSGSIQALNAIRSSLPAHPGISVKSYEAILRKDAR